MTIALPHGLPARAILEREGHSVADFDRAADANARPLQILLLNLMPEKVATETQIARLLAAPGLDLDLKLALPDGFAPKTTASDHIAAFYQPWSTLRERHFDALIITGAPVETLPFEAVTYWPVLAEILDWARAKVRRSYLICWAAQAALYHFHGVPKHSLKRKLFGVYEQRLVKPETALLNGLQAGFRVPVSRYAENRPGDLPPGRGLSILARSAAAGLCLLQEDTGQFLYMFNHLEYDADTLHREYRRDLAAGRPVAMPENYYPNDDPDREPIAEWQTAGQRLFFNWLAELAQTAQPNSKTQPDGSLEAVPRKLPLNAAPESIAMV